MVELKQDLKLALDPVTFAEEAGLEHLDPWQKDLLRSTNRRIIINASRQSGKSSVASVRALHSALYVPRSLILVLAPALRQSLEAFGKVLDAYRALGRPVPPEAENKLSLKLDNGSRIVSLPGTEKTVRGFSGTALLIVDEAARVEDALYHAVRPMLAVSGGALMMLSTPYGKRGAFFEEWVNGEGWERYEIPATEVPRISTEFLEEERRSLPERVFRQEYLCSFEETEDQVFSHAVVKRAFTDEYAPFDLGNHEELEGEGSAKKQAETRPASRQVIAGGSSSDELSHLDGRSYWSMGERWLSR